MIINKKALIIGSLIFTSQIAVAEMSSAIDGEQSERINKEKAYSVQDKVKSKLNKFYSSDANRKAFNLEQKTETSEWINVSRPIDCSEWKQINDDYQRHCYVKQIQSNKGYQIDEDKDYITDIEIEFKERTHKIIQYKSQVSPREAYDQFNLKNPVKENGEKKPIKIILDIPEKVNLNETAYLYWNGKGADFCSVEYYPYGKVNKVEGKVSVKITKPMPIEFKISCKNETGSFEYLKKIIEIEGENNSDIKGWFDISSKLMEGEPSIAYWGAENAVSCVLYLDGKGIGESQNYSTNSDIRGKTPFIIKEVGTHTFELKCKDKSGVTLQKKHEITIERNNSSIKITKLNTPESVPLNEVFTISWMSENTDYCNINFKTLNPNITYFTETYKKQTDTIDSFEVRTRHVGDHEVRLECFNGQDMAVETRKVLVTKIK